MNQLSDNDFKAILQQNEKSNQKMTDYRNICQMFCDVGSDIFRQIVNKYLDVSKQERVSRTNILSDEQKTKLCKHLYDQYTILHGLVEYFNENIKKTGKIYKCVYPGINHIYKWKSNYETYLKNIK
jgi:ribosomal protein S13